MTLHDARKRAFLQFLSVRKGKIIFNWNRIVEIRRKNGCNKRQLEKILEELKDTGEIVLKIYKGNIVVELVNHVKKAPGAGGHEALLEEKVSHNASPEIA